MKRYTFLGILLLVGAALLVACGGQSQAGQRPEPVKYTVEMTEYAFSPAELQVKVGQEVTIELVNNGQIEHEFMAGRQVKKTNNRPDGFEHDLFEDSQPVVTGGQEGASGEMSGHGASHSGFMVTLPKPGEKATVTFTPTQDMVGEWEIGCFSQDGVHYDAGMQGKLVVAQ